MKVKLKNNGDFFEMFNKKEPFGIISQPIATHYVATVDDEFESVSQFENIVRILDAASGADTVEIKLSTNGGALHSIIPLLSAIENTEAQVYVHAVSDVASAGTFLLMAADDVFINPYSTIMFHQVSFGAFGVGSTVESQVSHTIKSSKVLIQEIYKYFFTTDEIEQMLSGREFYMGKAEFDTRYEARKILYKAEIQAVEKALAEKKPKKKKTLPEIEE